MLFRSASSVTVLAGLLSLMLAGCSEHFDRRDGITLHTGEAVAANRVVHMIDPWPPASARRNIAYNGEKAATAAERYRTGKVIAPVNATTSSAAYAAAAAQAQSTANSQSSPSQNSNNNSSPVK
jgi:hypothetical protein